MERKLCVAGLESLGLGSLAVLLGGKIVFRALGRRFRVQGSESVAK